MKITVEFIAQLRDAAGSSSLTLECEPATTVGQVLRRLVEDRGEDFRGLVLDREGKLATSLLIAVGGKQVRGSEELPLADGDTLVLATPVAGG